MSNSLTNVPISVVSLVHLRHHGRIRDIVPHLPLQLLELFEQHPGVLSQLIELVLQLVVLNKDLVVTLHWNLVFLGVVLAVDLHWNLLFPFVALMVTFYWILVFPLVVLLVILDWNK